MLEFRCTLNPEQREQQFEVPNALDLHPSVVVDDIVERLQTHLHMFESVGVLALLAGVHVTGRHGHQGVQILSIGANEVQQAVGKALGILRGVGDRWGEGKEGEGEEDGKEGEEGKRRRERRGKGRRERRGRERRGKGRREGEEEGRVRK